EGDKGLGLGVGGETYRFRQGFFRFKVGAPASVGEGATGDKSRYGGTPTVEKLEYVRSTNNNTWGFGMSEEGIIFGSTANGNPSEYMPIPNRYYEAVPTWGASLQLRGIADSYKFKPITEHVRQVDWHGGYTPPAAPAPHT